MSTTPTETLTSLGLNDLEAEIYVHLLQHEPMTAYRVAQSLGRQTANVYKAMESLSRRGAVLIEEGESRLCRAVPVREFLRHTEREYLARTKAASEALAELHRPSFDERVYRVESIAQVFEQVSTMLQAARAIAVVDAFPAAAEKIRPAVEKAIRRGVKVYVQAYDDTVIKGAIHITPPDPAAVLAYWQSEQLNVVVDGEQCLVALLTRSLDGIHQALWSNSPYLAALLHGGLTAEHTLHRLSAATNERAMRRILGEHRFFLHDELPGSRALLARFQPKKKARK
ncbi:MAG TPA: helix-turn-helix domain-containing protein [Thermoanaerobaculia bacterium]|jgi:sugar-specific transcriptional regulator TrmB|nr:helix-turn-helix domain-containing protein [Thermoanaerobaculia bacterium]